MSVCVIGKEVAANDEFIEKFECKDNMDEETSSHGDGSNISLENESDAAGDGEDGLNDLTLETSKGLANTVIGLPRKKAKGMPVAFEKLLPQQREKNNLSWLVGMNAAEAAIKGKVITEDIVETIPENVNNAYIN